MSEDWAERQRHTNRLARCLAGHLFNQQEVTARQLYGLSKLAWITNSYEGDSAAYIRSTKIPALADILERDYSSLSLEQVAEDIAEILKDNSLKGLVRGHSGFTNFYKAYRNSVSGWIKKNYSELLPLYKAAFAPYDDKGRRKLIDAIAKLPGIPKANHPQQLMKPENFLTPAFFMLDPEIKFPLINGSKWVQDLLNALGAAGSDLSSQYTAMVRLYGEGGIRDAADLDQVGGDLPDFLTTDRKKATKKLLEQKNSTGDGDLPLKDEADVEAIRKAGSVTHRRVHNQLTNKLRVALAKHTLLEGKSQSCMFDVLVKRYTRKGDDLLIEVKSSIESPHIRMAVGQLFDYWHQLKGDEDPHLAVLLPERPVENVVAFLDWMDVGLMWFDGQRLCVGDKWLEHIASES